MNSESEYTVNLDFKKDYAEICANELISEGYTVTETDPFKVVVQYYNYKARLPEARSRRVLKSSTFLVSPDFEKAIAEIERKISAGETLKPHLSRRLTNLDYNDPMLNDWGIYHLHLNVEMEADGFVKRTSPLLFAYIDSVNAYFIAIGSHNSWADKDLMEIMHSDFPEVIEKYKIDGIEIGENLTSESIKRLRPRVNYFLQLSDGTIEVVRFSRTVR